MILQSENVISIFIAYSAQLWNYSTLSHGLLMLTAEMLTSPKSIWRLFNKTRFFDTHPNQSDYMPLHLKWQLAPVSLQQSRKKTQANTIPHTQLLANAFLLRWDPRSIPSVPQHNNVQAEVAVDVSSTEHTKACSCTFSSDRGDAKSLKRTGSHH